MNQIKSKYNFKRYCRTSFNMKLKHQKITGINTRRKEPTNLIKLSKRTMNPSNRHRFKSTGLKVFKKQQVLKAAIMEDETFNFLEFIRNLIYYWKF